MDRTEQLHRLKMKMIEWDGGDPKRIQHFLKVSSFAVAIAKEERADEHTLFILEALGYIHDIGIRIAEAQYGHNDGPLQEKLGPPAAREMLEELGFNNADIERICLLIANHHTYNADIDGLDFRILLEADACVNMYESDSPESAHRAMLKNIFQTKSGKYIYKMMFGIHDEESFLSSRV